MARYLTLSWRVSTAAFVLFFAGWLGVAVGDRDLPVTVISMEAGTPEVEPGGQFIAKYQFYRKRSCKTHVERMLFDIKGNRYVLSDLDFADGILPLGPDQVNVPVRLPERDKDGLPLPGLAIHRAVNCYSCTIPQQFVPVCDAPRDIKFNIK